MPPIPAGPVQAGGAGLSSWRRSPGPKLVVVGFDADRRKWLMAPDSHAVSAVLRCYVARRGSDVTERACPSAVLRCAIGLMLDAHPIIEATTNIWLGTSVTARRYPTIVLLSLALAS